MERPKASDAVKVHFRAVLPDHPDVVVKPMFGNLGAFVNGNLFVGLFAAERPMGGYTGLLEIWNAEGDGDEARANACVEKAFQHVAGLPPKVPKSPTTPKAKASKK